MKVKLWIDTGYVSTDGEFDEIVEVDSLEEAEELALEHLTDNIGYGFEVIEGDE